MLEFKVAQIVVDGVAALEELIEFGAVGRKVRSVGMNIKDKKKNGGGETEASAEHGVIA
jgi:hypothetical protein